MSPNGSVLSFQTTSIYKYLRFTETIFIENRGHNNLKPGGARNNGCEKYLKKRGHYHRQAGAKPSCFFYLMFATIYLALESVTRTSITLFTIPRAFVFPLACFHLIIFATW